MIKEIRYTGVTATPSDYISPDGELDAAINLVPENGELVVEQGGEVVFDLADKELENYKAIYIHNNTAPRYKNIILYDSGEGKVVWVGENEDKETWLCGDRIIDKTIKDVVSIGNVLVFLSENSTYYALWSEKKEDYEYLGDKLPELPISFGLNAKLPDGKTDVFSVGEMNNTFLSHHTIEGTRYDKDGNLHFRDPEELPPGMIDFFDAKIKGIVNEYISKNGTQKNRFCLPFMVRCAYRLKGDKGWINRSSPVLMIPCMIPEVQILWTNQDDSSVEIINEMAVGTNVVFADLDYAVFGNDVYVQNCINDIKKWSDVIEALDIFVTPPLYFYDGNVKIKRIIPAFSDPIGELGMTIDYWANYYKVPRISVSKLGTAAYSSLDSIINEQDGEFYDYVRFNTTNTNRYFALGAKTEEDIKDTVVNENRFYRIASVKIEELTIGRKKVEMDDGVLSSLEGRTALNETGAAHDHNTYVYGGGFVYNSRLIFYDVKKVSGVTKININTLLPYTNNYTPVPSDIRIYTAIEKKEGKMYKHNNGAANTVTGIVSNGGLPVPFLFLPEEELTDIAIGYVSNNNAYLYDEFKAIPHKKLVGVYLYLGFNNIVDSLKKEGIVEDYLNTELGGNHTFSQGNELYVSNVNQPFLFASANTVTIDAEGIIAVQSAVKALSEGQYGQFPLYIFAENGVFALEVASDGAFSKVKVVTNDVCNNPKSITKIDTSVLFITDRGIMLLSGSESICISDAIDSPAAFTTDILPKLGNLPHGAVGAAADMVPFREFLKKSRLLYDYNNQRIIVYNPEQIYAYVYSLKSKQWGMMESHIKYGINSYPECLAVDDENNIVNMSKVELEEGTKDCLIISRPLKLDDGDLLKTIDTIITRGKFRKGAVKTILYGSRDLFSWHLVASSVDHYLRGFRGTPYKYFRIVLACDLQKDESIFGSTIQYTPRLVDKIR